MNKKSFVNLPGFTLMEVLVSMFLFLTVTSLGYLLYMNVQRGIHRVKIDDSYLMHFIEFATLLEKDLQKALYVTEEANALHCHFGQEVKVYRFETEEVIVDTGEWQAIFPVVLKSKTTTFINHSDNVESIDFSFVFNGKELPLYIYKSCSGRSRMQNLLNHAHRD